MTQTQTIAKKVRKHLQFTSIIIYFDIKHDFLREKFKRFIKIIIIDINNRSVIFGRQTNKQTRKKIVLKRK